MVLKVLLVFLCILGESLLLEFIKIQSEKPQLQVHTKSGTVQGVRLKSIHLKKQYYYAFCGIPYAQPPVGELRFRSPKLVKNWSGVLDGSRQGSACIEVILKVDTRTSDITGTEDCLFLNVFTPVNPSNIKRPKPVMVFIHGGGFILGNPNITMYGPDLLLSKNVIVVTLNYRLGPFGFLSTEDLASPGNYGLKDQNMALRWIRKNIKFFGGDPDNITLFGHSAGSASVHFHMLSPKSEGLFHRVILESGSALCIWASQRKPRNIAYLFGLANGITNPKNNQDLVDRLRKVDIEKMKTVLVASTLAALSQTLVSGLPFAPSLECDHEEAFLSENKWYEMLQKGEFLRVPVLMGMNSNETLYFLQEFTAIKPFFFIFDLDNGLVVPSAMNISNSQTLSIVGRIILDHYFGKESKVANTNILDVLWYASEEAFMRPLWKTAELMSQYVPLYFYHFIYESNLGRYGLGEGREYEGIRGVCHEEEVHFIFNKFDNHPTKTNEFIVRDRLLTIWTNFAKSGNPTPPVTTERYVLGNLVWPTFSANNSSDKSFLEINETFQIRHVLDENANILWWDKLFQKYGNPPYLTY